MHAANFIYATREAASRLEALEQRLAFMLENLYGSMSEKVESREKPVEQRPGFVGMIEINMTSVHTKIDSMTAKISRLEDFFNGEKVDADLNSATYPTTAKSGW